MCALLGALVVPLAYLTVWELVQSTTAAILTGAIIICGKGGGGGGGGFKQLKMGMLIEYIVWVGGIPGCPGHSLLPPNPRP